jgi:hypothetical protein
MPARRRAAGSAARADAAPRDSRQPDNAGRRSLAALKPQFVSRPVTPLAKVASR